PPPRPDVHAPPPPQQTVALRDNESAETVKFRGTRQLCVEVPEKRTPRLRERVRKHSGDQGGWLWRACSNASRAPACSRAATVVQHRSATRGTRPLVA